MGARILKDFYPEFAELIGAKADAAYQEGVKKPGVAQTASVLSPYIYEEDNWVDDMELGAMELFHSTGDVKYLNQAVEYGRREPVTPWMGADSARHYQWYPFMNMGHYHLAKVGHPNVSKEFSRNLRSGIQRTYEKAVESPFLHGIPYIWCSNNLTTAMLTQCCLYRETTGDEQYAEMEASLRDWLFGCNPWGTSMIVELPLYGDYPIQSHSSYVMDRVTNTTGGIVDGPVYSNIFNNLIGVSLKGLPWQPGEDYARFQPERMVYHDAIGDYSTNECTMDGTACLTYYLSSMQAEGMKQANMEVDKNAYVNDGIERTNPEKKQLTLVFTAHDKADGAETIIRTLEKHGIQGAFFFTGRFYELYPDIIKTLLDKGHYVGGHSYGHLLYMPWENPDSLLVTREEFEADMMKSYDLMRKAGIEYKDAPLYIPPYEYYNKEISSWAKSMGIQVVNYTPGTASNADYTTPDMKNYRSSKSIFDQIMALEKKEGLNGHLMLIHFGTHDDRTDKFYNGYMEKMIKTLKRKGYTFAPIREAVGF